MAIKEKRVYHSYRKGGRPKSDEPPTSDAKAPAPNKSWESGNKGQGGEGLSEGYGGSAGDGTGPSGPEEKPEFTHTRSSPLERTHDRQNTSWAANRNDQPLPGDRRCHRHHGFGIFAFSFWPHSSTLSTDPTGNIPNQQGMSTAPGSPAQPK